jgi:hypothetical protein
MFWSAMHILYDREKWIISTFDLSEPTIDSDPVRSKAGASSIHPAPQEKKAIQSLRPAGSTPACGSKVSASGLTVSADLKIGPSV